MFKQNCALSVWLTISLAASVHFVKGLPHIKNLPQTLSIPEDTPLWETVFIVDSSNSSWDYDIKPNNSYFQIDGVCQVQVTAKLDYDNKLPPSPQILTISIADNGTGFSAVGNLTVYITNVYDIPPTFNTPFHALSLKEETFGDRLLDTPVANDSEVGDRLTYSLQGPHSTLFYIDPTSGGIWVTTPLDYDAGYHQLHVTVVAKDLGGNAARQDVVINVTDVNDNPPVCNLIYADVPENVTKNTTIATIRCSDKDSAAVTKLSYRILHGDDRSRKFAETGNTSIVTVSSLDYETNSAYRLLVEVYDDMASARRNTGTLTVVVKVTDVNDVPPVWVTTSQRITIAEDTAPGTSIFTFLAVDEDSGIGGIVNYTVVPSNTSTLCKVNSVSGELWTLMTLDYDKDQRSYLVMVRASDGTLTANPYVNLTVIISDINDNSPKFQKTSYHFNVKEDTTVADVIGTVLASDNDEGRNGDISYSINMFQQGSPQPFMIDSQLGNISVNGALDREATDVYVVRIVATDGGHPRLTGNAVLTILIEDINDNTPIFTTNVYSGSVTENISHVLNILKIEASDDDKYSNVTYQIGSTLTLGTSVNAIFRIGRLTGELSLITSVDRENDSEFVFLVLAIDKYNGLPTGFTSIATVSIAVMDVNDETPNWITTMTRLSIPENQPIGSSITTVSALDADTGDRGEVTYSMIGSSWNVFNLNTFTGEIGTASVLDRDSGLTSYSLTILATDGGGLNSTYLSLNISITDLNDNAPTFPTNHYVYNISEDAKRSTSARPVTGLSYTARDPDADNNGKVDYTISSFLSGDSAHFVINRLNGVISTTGGLDREREDVYVFEVMATDRGVHSLSGSTTVTIRILDVNDHQPMFSSASYTGTVSEKSPVGTSIIALSVTDGDVGTNGAISFSIGPHITRPGADAKRFFSVNSSTRILSLNTSLDRETCDRFVFNVLAFDGGTPSLNSSTTVTIFVDDYNDNAPVMAPLFYNTEVAHNGPVGIL